MPGKPRRVWLCGEYVRTKNVRHRVTETQRKPNQEQVSHRSAAVPLYDNSEDNDRVSIERSPDKGDIRLRFRRRLQKQSLVT